MFIHATEVKFLEGVEVEVSFQDGKVIRYNMSKMFLKYPQLKKLKEDRKLFESGHLDSLGNAIIWNEELDFDVMSIYEAGEVISIKETTLNEKIGTLLIKTRDELNITQKELSKLSHIDQGDISKIERGLGNPTLSKIEKIFKALGKEIKVEVLSSFSSWE